MRGGQTSEGPGAGEAAAFREELDRLARGWGVAMTEQQAGQLDGFARLLLGWSARINLTGAESVGALAAEHLPDAFALASRVARGTLSVVDVGSGGGLPAVPLALLVPELRVTLVEPVAKKVAFLRTAVRNLDLGGRVAVRSVRVEQLTASEVGRFDAAVSRAAFPPPVWAAMGARLVRPGGRVFVLAGAPLRGALAGLAVVDETAYLEGRRWLVELERPSCST